MTINTNTTFKLGNWHIDPILNKVELPSQQLNHQLSPKLMQMLQLLVEYGHQPVDIDTIMSSVWQDKVVSDSSVYQAIAQLRKILNSDNHHKQYIERVSAKGYRIADSIEVSQQNASTKRTVKHRVAFFTIALVAIIFSLTMLFPLEQDDDEYFESLTLAHYLQSMSDPEQIKQAQQLYKDILQSDSNNIKALVGLCTTYRRLSFYGDLPYIERDTLCQPLLQKAYKLQPNNPKVLASLAKQATEQGDKDNATVLFKKALVQDPETSDIWRWYGQLLRQQNNINEALQAHQQAFKLAPNDPLVLRALAYSHLNNRDIPQAQKYYQRSNIITPNFTHRPLYDLDFYPLTQRRAQAYLDWHQHFYPSLVEKYPSYQYSHVLLLLSLDQLEQAQGTLAKIHHSDSFTGFELYVNASVAWYQGDNQKALALLQQRYQLATDQNHYVMPYIMALLHSDNEQLALALFSKHFSSIVNTTKTLETNTIPQYLLFVSLLKANDRDYQFVYQKLNQYRQTHNNFELNSEIHWQALRNNQSKINQLLTKKVKQGWLPDYNDNMFTLRYYKSIAGNGHWLRLLTQQQACIVASQSGSCSHAAPLEATN